MERLYGQERNAVLSPGLFKASRSKWGPLITLVIVAAFNTGCKGTLGINTGDRSTSTYRSTATFSSSMRNDVRPSRMLKSAVAQDLLYVSNPQKVTVYSYPQGVLVGTLKGFSIATGICVDRGGDVFIVDTGYRKIFEYAHGNSKRIATLDSKTADPVGCAIDPVTGNLAVGSQGTGSKPAVEIFKKARGTPTLFNDAAFYQFYFCGYDDKGNLFADGITSPGSGHFGLAELPAGKNALVNLDVDGYVLFPGGVQWDGKYIVIGDQRAKLFDLLLSGRRASIVRTIKLGSGAEFVKQSWIQSGTLIAPNQYFKSGIHSEDVLFYGYPAGGKATKKITAGVTGANGATVSVASGRQ